jgi:hypothetical protein
MQIKGRLLARPIAAGYPRGSFQAQSFAPYISKLVTAFLGLSGAGK